MVLQVDEQNVRGLQRIGCEKYALIRRKSSNNVAYQEAGNLSVGR